MKIAYCGYTDRRNVGDYALYRANQSLFAAHELIDAREDPDTAVNLVGGGTLYPWSLRYGYRRRRHNLAIGMGVSPPERSRFGLRTRWSMMRWRLARAGVRGPRSRQVLLDHGIPSIVTGDTALALEPPRGAAEVRSETIGLVVAGATSGRRGDPEHVVQQCAVAGRRLMAEGFSLRVLPCCVDDLEASERLVAKLGTPGACELVDFWAPPVNEDLKAMLEQFARCRLVISERLHGAVLAAAAGVMFISIGYKEKCHDFVESLGVPRLCVFDPQRLAGHELAAEAERLIADEETTSRTQAAVADLRIRLREHAASIEDYLATHVSSAG